MSIMLGIKSKFMPWYFLEHSHMSKKEGEAQKKSASMEKNTVSNVSNASVLQKI